MLNKKNIIRNLIQKPLIVKKKMHKMIRMNNAKWSKMKAENATIGKVLLRQSLLLVYHFQAFSWAEVERVRSDLLTVRFNYVFRIFTKTRRWMSDWFHTWRCVFTRRSRRRRCRCRHFIFLHDFDSRHKLKKRKIITIGDGLVGWWLVGKKVKLKKIRLKTEKGNKKTSRRDERP